MIHEEICTYEVCKLAKEKGFPQEVSRWCDFTSPSRNYYNHKGELNGDCLEIIKYICRKEEVPIELQTIAAPTQSLLQRWLREEKGVTICVDIFDDGWFFDISTFYKQDTGIYEIDMPYKSSNVSPVYDTYELALEDALKYALENLV